MTEDPYERKVNPLLVVISGASAVGKDTVIRRMEELGHPFCFVVTATTRHRREGEIDGRDYLFLTEYEFLRMIKQNEFLEHALVYGQYKGIPKVHVRDALAGGQDVIMRVDVQGAATIRHLVPQAVLIFLITSSEEELIGRLKRRGTESMEDLSLRMKTIREEMKRREEFDYIVVNADGMLDDAVEQIVCIIRAEKCRVQQRPKVEL